MYGYRMFRDFDEAMMAYVNRQLGLHSRIRVRIHRDVKETAPDGTETVVNRSAVIVTTLGRLIFNSPLPQDLGFVDRSDPANTFKLEVEFVVKKKQLGQIIDRCIRAHGTSVCAEMLDNIKAMGYKYSTQASFSISVYDMTIPPEKPGYLAAALQDVDTISKHFAAASCPKRSDTRRSSVSGKRQPTMLPPHWIRASASSTRSRSWRIPAPAVP